MTKNAKIRGFEVAKGFENKQINLPKRATKNAAGYDFEAAETIIIPSIITTIKNLILHHKNDNMNALKPKLVPTGVKAYMPNNEYLQLANRSSNPLKKCLLLANGIGVIDADYYENENNDGHIMFQFINWSLRDKVIEKGERIGQGTFIHFEITDDDVSTKERTGGFGSSDKQ